MKGRKKKATALKVLSGTDQPCRRNPDEPKPDIIDGADCPAHLLDDEVALKTWEWVIPVLKNMKVLTIADLETVTRYCEVVSDIRELRANLKKHGRISYIVKADSMGNEIVEAKSNPAAVQYNNLMTQYRGFCSMLGLDPTSRPRLKTYQSEKKDDFETFING